MILPTNPNDILGILGISLEFANFVLKFHAVKPNQTTTARWLLPEQLFKEEFYY
jgi:hypothetical protein